MPDRKLITFSFYRFSSRYLSQNFIDGVIWNRWINYLFYCRCSCFENIENGIEREIHAR